MVPKTQEPVTNGEQKRSLKSICAKKLDHKIIKVACKEMGFKNLGERFTG